jgi:hypothetical protein
MLTIDASVKTTHTPSPDGTPETGVKLFTLTQNHGYVAREASLAVRSTDNNWIPAPIIVTQSGTAPSLTLTQPADLGDATTATFDISSSATTDLTFSTNANWTFTTGSGYADVVTTTKYGNSAINAPYTNEENNDALQNLPYSINLTKHTGLADEKAYTSPNTPYEGYLTLETANHGDAPLKTRTVKVTRDVVPLWSAPALTPTGSELSEEGEAVVVTAHTNMPWMVEYNINGGPYTTAQISPTAYNDSDNKYTFSIGANTTSFSSRTVHVKVHEVTNTDAIPDTEKTYTQLGATLSYVSATVSPPGHQIPAAGVNPSTNVTLNFSGTYAGDFTVTAYGGSTPVGANTNSTKTSRGVTVLENQSWTDRIITYKWSASGYNNNNEPDIPSLQTTQLGYKPTISGNTYYFSGNAYSFSVNGTYPSGTSIRFVKESDSNVVLHSASATTGSQATSVIPKNTGNVLIQAVNFSPPVYYGIRTITELDPTFTYNNVTYGVTRVTIYYNAYQSGTYTFAQLGLPTSSYCPSPWSNTALPSTSDTFRQLLVDCVSKGYTVAGQYEPNLSGGFLINTATVNYSAAKTQGYYGFSVTGNILDITTNLTTTSKLYESMNIQGAVSFYILVRKP